MNEISNVKVHLRTLSMVLANKSRTIYDVPTLNLLNLNLCNLFKNIIIACAHSISYYMHVSRNCKRHFALIST